MRRFCFIVGLFFSSSLLFSQQLSERKLGRQLKKIPQLANAFVGISVLSLEKHKVVAAYNASNYFTPASNTKLLTFLGAVQTFSKLPALEYAIENDSIAHFKSTGYPLLFHPFYPDTVLQNYFQDKQTWIYHPAKTAPNLLGSGWSWDDYSYYYAAPSSVFPIYGNTVQGIIKENSPQFIPSFPASPDSRVTNLQRSLSENTFLYNPQNWSSEDTLYRPFLPNDPLFVKLLGKALDKKVILDTTTGDSFPWQKLITEQDPLLYKGLLHDSDNGIAEALLLMIAHEKAGVFRPEVAIDSLKEQWKYWLPDPLEWVDGSGVSRYNMFTPRTLVAVLQQLKQKLSWEVLSAYMPQGGATGTLKAYPDLVNVYAKTGTLRHNHNLSGYWVNANGKHYAFSILVNHFTTPTVEVRQGISELLLWMQRKAK